MVQSFLHLPNAPTLGACAFMPDERALLAERIAEALRGAGEVWLLTGERGSGRTALLDDAVARMPGPPARLVRVKAGPDGDGLTLRGFVAQVAGKTGPGAAGDALERAFELLAGDEPTVLVIDGADHLAVEVLRYVQLAARSAPGLQLFLVALPGFRAVLERDEFAHLRSRLGPELVVPRLSDEDAARYVRHRLGMARTSPAREMDGQMDGPALDALVRAGQGLPGRLDRLLDQALAFGVERGERRLTAAAVQRAVHALDHPDAPPPAEPPAVPVPVPDRVASQVAPGPAAVSEPPARLAPPRPIPRRPLRAAAVGAVLGAALVAAAGLGAWALVGARRDVPPPPRTEPSPPAAAPAPVPAPAPAAPVQEAARPAPAPPPVVPPPVVPTDRPAPPPPAPPSITPELASALLARGEAMLAVGDVSAARLLFERAAAGGGAPALRAAGRAYDPAVLARLGAVGIRPDAARAADYYRRAAALGDAEARRLLGQLDAGKNGR